MVSVMASRSVARPPKFSRDARGVITSIPGLYRGVAVISVQNGGSAKWQAAGFWSQLSRFESSTTSGRFGDTAQLPRKFTRHDERAFSALTSVDMATAHCISCQRVIVGAIRSCRGVTGFELDGERLLHSRRSWFESNETHAAPGSQVPSSRRGRSAVRFGRAGYHTVR